MWWDEISVSVQLRCTYFFAGKYPPIVRKVSPWLYEEGCCSNSKFIFRVQLRPSFTSPETASIIVYETWHRPGLSILLAIAGHAWSYGHSRCCLTHTLCLTHCEIVHVSILGHSTVTYSRKMKSIANGLWINYSKPSFGCWSHSHSAWWACVQCRVSNCEIQCDSFYGVASHMWFREKGIGDHAVGLFCVNRQFDCCESPLCESIEKP